MNDVVAQEEQQEPNWDGTPEYGEEIVDEETAPEEIQSEESDSEAVAEEPQHDWEKRYKDLEQSHSRRGNEVHKYKKELDDLRFQKLEMQQKLLELEQLKKSSANESDNNTDDPYSDENYWTDAEKEILKEYPEIVGVAEKFAKRESLLAERRLQDAKPSYTDKIEKLEEKIEEQTRYISRQQAFARLDELVGPVWREVDEDPDFHQYVNDSRVRRKIMDNGDLEERAEILQNFLEIRKVKDTTSPAQPQNEDRRKAVQGMVKGQPPKGKPKGEMSEAELWDSIPDE